MEAGGDLPHPVNEPREEVVRLITADHPDAEQVIDCGAAKSRKLDARLMKAYRKRTGKGPVRRVEADWLATAEALYYVAPDLGEYLRWPWSQVEVDLERQRPTFARVSLQVEDARHRMGLGSRAVMNFLAIAERHRPED